MTDMDLEEILEIIDPPKPPTLPVNILLGTALAFFGLAIGVAIARMWI